MRVLAAMSGGVDSAVAAALVAEQGHEVVGVHMALLRNRQLFREGSRGCCSIEDAQDARRVADQIGIPFYVWDLSENFQETVVSDFLEEYAAGRTPNPCVRCNEHVKFETLLARASALGFDAVATGHYAQVLYDDAGRPSLHRSPNAAKDQSYVLAVMGPDRLAHAMFPLGGFASKDQVRAEAEKRGFGLSSKPDSYDICFIPDGDTRGFLADRLGDRPGPIVDSTGEQVGQHQGAYAFTVGQRKGLHLGRPAANGQPRYVTQVNTRTNTVVVGPLELLSVNHIECTDVVMYDSAQAGEPLEVQVRAHGQPVACTVTVLAAGTAGAAGAAGQDATSAAQLDAGADSGLGPEPGGAASDSGPEPGGAAKMVISLTDQMLRGVAAGQSAVIYRADRVIAQGTIASARRISEKGEQVRPVDQR